MISPAAILLCSVFLFATAALAVCVARSKHATTLTYGLSCGLSAIAFAVAIGALATMVSPNAASTLVLPIGLPWLGSHFRLDALSAFFLAVINFGGMLASLYALGYGRHEHAPHRVLPFFPAFVAGMNLVILADDAFTFLMSWEFMSLASWALVMAHHRDAGNRKAGYLYIVMASFGTLTLLLAFGLLAGPDGNYSFATMRAAVHAPLTSGWSSSCC